MTADPWLTNRLFEPSTGPRAVAYDLTDTRPGADLNQDDIATVRAALLSGRVPRPRISASVTRSVLAFPAVLAATGLLVMALAGTPLLVIGALAVLIVTGQVWLVLSYTRNPVLRRRVVEVTPSTEPGLLHDAVVAAATVANLADDATDPDVPVGQVKNLLRACDRTTSGHTRLALIAAARAKVEAFTLYAESLRSRFPDLVARRVAYAPTDNPVIAEAVADLPQP